MSSAIAVLVGLYCIFITVLQKCNAQQDFLFVKDTGQDVANCGQILNNPCKSISFAINQISVPVPTGTQKGIRVLDAIPQIITGTIGFTQGLVGTGFFIEGTDPRGAQIECSNKNFPAFSANGVTGLVQFSNVTVSNCQQGLFLTGARALLLSCTVQNNQLGIHAVGSSINLRNCGLYDNNGGSALFLEASDSEVVASQFLRNTAANGGGVQALGSNFRCQGCTFSRNVANANGAALFARNSTVNLASTDISDNNAATTEGVVYLQSVTAMINDTTIENNKIASTSANGVFVAYQSSVTMGKSKVVNNVRGAQIISGTSVVLEGCSFSNNDAWGLYLGSPTQTVTSCIVSNNFGTGVYVVGSSGNLATLNIRDTSVSGNVASTNGGGIYLEFANAEMHNVTILNNTGDTGGGVHAENSALDIHDSTISGNKANAKGGGIYVEFSNMDITKTVISGNSLPSGGQGCGIYAHASNAEMGNITLGSNSGPGTDGGGGYFYTPVKASGTNVITFISSTVTLNTAENGAGIFVVNANLRVTGTNIRDNTASGSGGGILAFNTTMLDCDGATLAGNDAKLGGGLYALNCTGRINSARFEQNTATKFGIELFTFDSDFIISSTFASVTLNSIALMEATARQINPRTGSGRLCCNSQSFGSGPNAALCYGCSSTCSPAAACTCDGTRLYPHSRLIDPADCSCGDPPIDAQCAVLPTTASTPTTTTQPSSTGTSTAVPTGTSSDTTAPSSTGSTGTSTGTSPDTTSSTAPSSTTQPTGTPSTTQPTGTSTGTSPDTTAPSSTTQPTGTSTGTGSSTQTTSGTSQGTSGTGIVPPATSAGTSTTSPSSTTSIPAPVCGNGVTEPGEECDSTEACCDQRICRFIAQGTVCRSSRGVCDVSDQCTGSSSVCGDIIRGNTFTCGVSDGSCSILAACGLSISACPPNTIVPVDKCGVCGGNNLTCTPNVCGNLQCDEGETCSNCPSDCLCEPTQCTSNCNFPNGRCENGLCLCNAPWSGPTCNSLNQIIIAKPSDTSPSVNVTTVNVTFAVAVREVREKSPAGNIMSSYSFNTQDITVTANVTSTSTEWQYTTTLDNKAEIRFSFLQVKDATTISFANQVFDLVPNALKVTIFVSNWPFYSMANTLELVMNISVPGGPNPGEPWPCTDFKSEEDEQGNLRTIIYSVNGESFVGKFLDVSVLDGNTRPLAVSLSSDREVVLSLPHFWSYAAIDPDFSVIVDPIQRDKCDKEIDNKLNRTQRTVAIAVGSALGGLALIIIASSYVYIKHRRKKAKQELRRKARAAEMRISGSTAAQ